MAVRVLKTEGISLLERSAHPGDSPQVLAGGSPLAYMHPLSDPPVLSGFHTWLRPATRKSDGLGWAGEERVSSRAEEALAAARSVCPLFSTAGLQLSGQEGRSAAAGATGPYGKESSQQSGLGEILPLSLSRSRPIMPRRPTWKLSCEQLAEEQPNCAMNISVPCVATPHKNTERV